MMFMATAISLLTVLFVINLLFLKHIRRRDIKNFQIVHQKITGNLISGLPRFSKFFNFISAPHIIFQVRYSELDFTVIVDYGTWVSGGLSCFNVTAKTDSKLLSFGIIKNKSPFALSSADILISEQGKQEYREYAKTRSEKSGNKNIIINGKRYCLYSYDINKISELIKLADIIKLFQCLLPKFRSIEIVNDTITMAKRHSKKDTIPDNLIELLNTISGLAQSVKIA